MKKFLAALMMVLASTVGAQTIKETKVLGVVVSYSDKANTASPSSWTKALFTASNSVQKFYAEGSGGTHLLSGTVIPTAVVVPQTRPTGTCARPDYNKLATAIRAAGYKLEEYKTLVMSAVRSTGGCGNSFASTFYYTDTITWTTRSMKLVVMWESPNTAILAHELLHTEGLKHANKLGCTSGAIGPFCLPTEYGNPADIMGSAGQYQTTNAIMRKILGWGTQVTHPGGAATYTIGASYTPGVLPNAIVIPVRDPSGVKILAPLVMTIEYRSPFGFDSRMLTKSSLNSYITGAMVNVTGAWEAVSSTGRLYYANCRSGSCLLDMTPEDNNHSNGALQVGTTWSDPFTGVTITVDGRTDTTMTITVRN